MSRLLDAEKLRRKLEKLSLKRTEKLASVEADYAEKVRAAKAEAGDEVCCLLDSAVNLSSEAAQ